MQLRALVVDDEDRPRALVEDLLVGRGHSVTSAATLEEARAALEGVHFDLVVMDLCIPVSAGRLPQADLGYELERAVRARLPKAETYLIVLTGKGLGAMDSSLAHDHGCDAYVLKGDRERLLLKLAEGEARARARLQKNQRRAPDELPLKATSWKDCTLILSDPARARTRAGAEARVPLNDTLEKVLYHLQISEEGSDLSAIASADATRRSLARDARKFLRRVFQVQGGPKDPVPYQRARKAWISLVTIREADLDQVRESYEELRRKDHDMFDPDGL